MLVAGDVLSDTFKGRRTCIQLIISSSAVRTPLPEDLSRLPMFCGPTLSYSLILKPFSDGTVEPLWLSQTHGESCGWGEARLTVPRGRVDEGICF